MAQKTLYIMDIMYSTVVSYLLLRVGHEYLEAETILLQMSFFFFRISFTYRLTSFSGSPQSNHICTGASP